MATKIQVYLYKDNANGFWKEQDEFCKDSEYIPIIQGEAGSIMLNFHLFLSRSVPIDLAGKTVTFFFTKPDGEKIFLPADVSEKTATEGMAVVTFTAQSTAVSGLTKHGEVRVTADDGSVLKFQTPNIFIASSNTEGAIESTSEFHALDVALGAANTNLKATASAVEAAQKVVIDSQKAIINATNAAADAKEKAEAATQAATAASSATAAATSATQNAGDSSQAANTAANQAACSANQADSAAQRAATAAASCENITATITAQIDTQKGMIGGLASLNAQKKLVQMPTAADVGAMPKVEIGNWIPVLSGATTAGTPTYVAQPAGKYYKFGNLVIVLLTFQLSGKGGMTGQVQIGGLPFKAIEHGCVNITSAYGLTQGTCNALILAYTSYITLCDASNLLDNTAIWAASGYYICS